ncbi:hypothetical protein ABBQ38_001874 [Trebouxia sp. C0009 RCD-2024]
MNVMLGQQKLRTDHTDVSAPDAAEAQPIVDVQDVPSTSCRICMSDHLQHPAKIQTCGHRFCLECIRRWSRSSPEPRCPLCNASFTVLVHSGTEEELPISASQRSKVEADLGCLDHAYFTTETRRLISRATSAQHAVYRSVQNCGRAGTSESAQAYGILSDVIANLNSYKSSMEEEVPFEAEHVLQELYNLDAVVQGVQAGTWERNAPQEAPRRYSADDAEDMSDDDDGFDECTWDVAANSSAAYSSTTNRSVSKTPGRPPPHRNQRRARHGHARRS